MISKKLREQVLERDNHECQASHFFGLFYKIFGLTEEPGIDRCAGNLQIHHKTYERYGKELLEDLITLCKKHHDIITNEIRSQRYSNMEHVPSNIEQKTPIFKIKIRRFKNAKVSMQNCRDYSPNHAQGRYGGSSRSFYQGDQEDQQKTYEDGSRS